ncbi:MAG: RdgB/HAM1 family non-canonical purine NTP pyrophosphatase [Rhodospirillales bacterium]|nr:RdgB/HAM1 family non-canonical purine NTP pyrophosphatase [Rhodospirillales bacterium]MCB9964729.1 RdgB/HAM1 family non-canonical purine NTP pyrophosphatase [Rhodospirillales bacterium]MCB9980623.1 RdgB/HAM1 family non-canonical purine NTP pyrophosphatase [Rhodospirillales bacterium]
MEKLLIATHNPGKVKEFEELMAPRGILVTSAVEYHLEEPPETGATFEENALIKARAACEATGLPALADDSGLCVDALDGAPGVHSARWAGPKKDFPAAMTRIHQALEKTDSRKAHFVCVLALALPDGAYRFYQGRCDGDLVWPPRGLEGFGYDPIFQPSGQTHTFAEMSSAEKHTFSHRGRAIQKFLESL